MYPDSLSKQQPLCTEPSSDHPKAAFLFRDACQADVVKCEDVLASKVLETRRPFSRPCGPIASVRFVNW